MLALLESIQETARDRRVPFAIPKLYQSDKKLQQMR